MEFGERKTEAAERNATAFRLWILFHISIRRRNVAFGIRAKVIMIRWHSHCGIVNKLALGADFCSVNSNCATGGTIDVRFRIGINMTHVRRTQLCSFGTE